MGFIKDFFIRIGLKDEFTGPMRDAQGKFIKTQKKMVDTSKSLVGDKMGKAWGGFNEKTERARQLLFMLPGPMGQVAGSAVYMTGTLGAFIGKGSLFEIGIMAMIAALAGLGIAFAALADDELAATERAMQRLQKESRKTTDELNKMYEAQLKSMSGLTDAEWTMRKYVSTLEVSNIMLEEEARLQGELDEKIAGRDTKVTSFITVYGQEQEIRKKSLGFRERENAQIQKNIELLEKTIKLQRAEAILARADKKLEDAAVKREKEKEAAAKRWLANRKRAQKEAETNIKRQQKSELARLIAIDDARKAVQKMEIDGERAHQEGMAQIREENENRKMLIAANASALSNQRFEEGLKEQEKLKQDHDAVMAEYEMEAKATTVGAIQALVEEGMPGMLRFLAMKMKMKAFEAAAEALWMTAVGISYLAIPGLQGNAALAFSSAGKFAAFAAAYGIASAGLSAMAGPSGGATATAGRGRETGLGNQWTAEDAKGEVTIIIQAGVITSAKKVGKELQNLLDANERAEHPGMNIRKLS
jgi:hypothetical protein